MAKTSTFIIDHDRCRPETWTARDILTIERFVKTGDLQCAAAMSRLGVRLVVSEFHQPVGGTLEEVGWSAPFGFGDDVSAASDLRDIAEDVTVATPVCRVYRGPTEYAFGIPIDDGDGDVGYEMETRPTEAEANAVLAEIYSAEVER